MVTLVFSLLGYKNNANPMDGFCPLNRYSSNYTGFSGLPRKEHWKLMAQEELRLQESLNRFRN
jgi:hypothetical protein